MKAVDVFSTSNAGKSKRCGWERRGRQKSIVRNVFQMNFDQVPVRNGVGEIAINGVSYRNMSLFLVFCFNPKEFT